MKIATALTAFFFIVVACDVLKPAVLFANSTRDSLMLRKGDAGQVSDSKAIEIFFDRADQDPHPRRYIIQLVTNEGFDAYRVGASAELVAEANRKFSSSMERLASDITRRGSSSVREITRLLPLPLMIVESNATDLRLLISSDEVAAVYEDFTLRHFLHQTLPLIEAETLNSAGGNGQGYSVAVIDSGIQRSHPIFSGKIVEEACFASGFPSYPACPSGHATPSTSPGAAETCTGSDSCFHGTHVAAIAAGHPSATPQGPAIKGVAQSAGLVPIRAGSLSLDDTCFPEQACVRYKWTDLAAALSWLYGRHEAINLASVNISLGFFGGSFHGNCDYWYPPASMQIDFLSGAGIAIVVASGNEGLKRPGEMAFPACVERAISVASVDMEGAFAPYSNVNPTLDLLAPGGNSNPVTKDCSGNHQCILSAMPGGNYGYAFGTSMAAPHVAGAIAGLRNLWTKEEVSVATIVQRLKDSGRRINFSVANVNYEQPLIQLGAALNPPLEIPLAPILMLLLDD